jgi:hypothetical protein
MKDPRGSRETGNSQLTSRDDALEGERRAGYLLDAALS